MFGRASCAASICLRCQSRLVKRPKLWPGPTPAPAPAILQQQRQQSVIAAQVAQEAEVADENNVEQRSQRRARAYRDKRWRPVPTKELGITSLGAPAEILVLPERRRRARRDSADDDDEDGSRAADGTELAEEKTPSQLNVQDSLAQELRPVTAEEVRLNIEVIRDRVGGTGAQLSPVQWARARNSLSDGFTKEQLRNYINHNISAERAISADEVNKPATSNKKTIAAWLLRNVWDMQSDHSEAAPAQPQRNISFSKQDLEVIIRGKAQYLADLASKYSVKIDVFKSDARMVLSGPRDKIQTVVKLIKPLKSTILTINYTFPDFVVNTLEPKFVSEVAERYGVVISLTGGHAEFYGFDPLNVAAAYRELYINGRDPRKLRQLPPIFPGESKLSADLLPVRQPPKRPADQRYRFRFVCNDGPQSARHREPSSRNVDQAIQGVVASLLKRRDSNPLLKPLWSAHLAESIWKDTGLDRSETTPAAQVKTISHTEIPLLTQFLKGMPILDTGNCAHLRDLTAGDQELYRLKFERPHGRGIEMYLSRPHPIDGTAMPLQLRQLRLIMRSHSRSILLPSHLVDMNVNDAGIVPIFDSGAQLDEAYAPILAQVASYLKLTASAPDLSFAAVLELDLTTLYDKARSAETGPRVSTRAPKQAQKNLAHEKLDSWSWLKATSKDSPPYILERAERVERATYLVPTDSNSVLEHLKFNPLSSSLVQEPYEVLRLVDIPLCHVPVAVEDRVSQEDTQDPRPADTSTGVDYDSLSEDRFLALIEGGALDKTERDDAGDLSPRRIPEHESRRDTAVEKWRSSIATDQQHLKERLTMAYGLVKDLTKFVRRHEKEVAARANL